MKFYMVMAVMEKSDGCMEIVYRKELFLFREHAFDRAQELGGTSVVLELTQTESWNYEQIRRED